MVEETKGGVEETKGEGDKKKECNEETKRGF
jgi:hypothetical protein